MRRDWFGFAWWMFLSGGAGCVLGIYATTQWDEDRIDHAERSEAFQRSISEGLRADLLDARAALDAAEVDRRKGEHIPAVWPPLPTKE